DSQHSVYVEAGDRQEMPEVRRAGDHARVVREIVLTCTPHRSHEPRRLRDTEFSCTAGPAHAAASDPSQRGETVRSGSGSWFLPEGRAPRRPVAVASAPL